MILLILLTCITTSIALPVDSKNDTNIESPSNSTKEILKASETGDPTKVEIVKQIRRLNEDGSYTIGYEANDGTFKIESRDVLGNVKGTFGYISDDGEIKRVTYTSNGESTPIPVSTTTTTSTPPMIVRVNKTVSSTTRRPLATLVYPTRSSATTRGTVIQPIPRRRPVTSARPPPMLDPTTEKIKHEETTANILHIYKPKEDIMKHRTQILNPISASSDDLIPKSTTTNPPHTLKPVYEEVTEKEKDTKSNAIRRQLSGTSHNHHMVSLQQSMGDDSTDVYGGHSSHGTIRPLFTTTTPRSRYHSLHSIISPRQQAPNPYQEVQLQDQETTIESSTGRVFEQQNVVTTNAGPVVRIGGPRDHHEATNQYTQYDQPIYRRPAAVHFRTDQYLRDNPGAPIPIGNTRPFLQYEYEDKVLEPHNVKDTPQSKATAHDPATVQYDGRPVRLIPIPVDDRGVPIPGYQARFVNYRPQPVQRYDPYDDMSSITAPVSTRDFRRLLHILMLRQNRLQAIMDQLMPKPYHNVQYNQDYQRRYDDDRYDYDQYRQDYSYDNQYESQRYVPRRRYRPYDSVSSASNNIDDSEYLPVEVREALLLKMLILAISPDYMPTPAPSTELTTAAPGRKQVRNIQILGEEGSSDSKQK
ncbi:uncharacterized protein LOC125051344 [Pieris napi]|uniref:uncharacterized protein LOC125051344 n=1 Tax=Pieris napi TaxID=78633 RepID=UPI001FB9ED11|nr:uncharacterized protein LOC125051344 [Pieris napi]